MKNLIYALFIYLCVGLPLAYGQQMSRDFWHDGEVNLFSGETLKGKLKYDLDTDNLQLQFNGTIKSFSAYQVESFQFFDEVLKVPRSFYALPYKKMSNYESPVFFELFTEGFLTLLNREIITYRMMYPSGFGGWGYRPWMGTNVPVLDDSYYVLLMKEERVIKLVEIKKDILYLMEDKTKEVEGFINANRIRFDRREDLVRLFDFYNSLKPKIN
jgi:hypothetical protein